MSEPQTEPKLNESAPTRPMAVAAAAAFWAALWLAVALVACKAAAPKDSFEKVAQTRDEKLRYVMVMVHEDLVYASGVGLVGATLLLLARRRKRAAGAVWAAMVLLGAASVVYAVASVPIFRFLGTPLTYPMLHVAGNFAHMGSSVANFLTARLVAALVLMPLAYVAAVLVSRRLLTPHRPSWLVPATALLLIAFVGADFAWGRREVRVAWGGRDDKGITRSAHWTFITSWLSEVAGGGDHVRVSEPFPSEYADDFRTVAERRGGGGGGGDAGGSAKPRAATTSPLSPPSASLTTLLSSARPRNVIVLVMESVSTHYLSLYGSSYDTTPRLVREAGSSLVFDNVYSHVGMTANSLVSILLGVFPPVTWRQLTDDRPDLAGTSLAAVMKNAGYRTAFITSGDNEYVNTARFLVGRGFDVVWDVKGLGAPYLFTWGCEDRHMIDGLVRFIDQDPAHGKPFFALTWTQQTHHPYPLSETAAEIDFFKGGPTPEDDWDLGHYLNAIHEADRQIGRVIDALRERGIAQETLIVITGDHGEAFGSPHPTYGHGPRVWEENLHVPFVLWNPRLAAAAEKGVIPNIRGAVAAENRNDPFFRSAQIGGLCDLGATVCDVIGVAPPGDWQGHSLLDPAHPPRTYFSAANDGYLLAVREGPFKYILNATAGKEMLFDLMADPTEQKNVAAANRETATEMRKRISAWMTSQKQRYGAAER